MIDWIHIGPHVTAAFLASLVEFVEALTIVLAVGTVRGWRPALIGTGRRTDNPRRARRFPWPRARSYSDLGATAGYWEFAFALRFELAAKGGAASCRYDSPA